MQPMDITITHSPSKLRHHRRKNTSLLEETGDRHMQPMDITITHSPSKLRHHRRKNTSLLEETGDQHMQPMDITITQSPKQRCSVKPNALSNISGPTKQFTSTQLSRESIGQVHLKKMKPHALITTRHTHRAGGRGFGPFQIETILKGKGLAISHKCDSKQQFAEAHSQYQSF